MNYAILILMIVSYAGLAQANEKTCDLLVKRVLQKDKYLSNLPPRIAQSKLLMNLSKRVESAVNLHADEESLLKFCETALKEKSFEGLDKQKNNKSRGNAEESMAETAKSIATTGTATQKILMSDMKEEPDSSISLVPDCSIFDFLFCAPPNPIDNGTISPLLSIASSLIGMEEKICNCVQEKAKSFSL